MDCIPDEKLISNMPFVLLAALLAFLLPFIIAHLWDWWHGTFNGPASSGAP